MRYEEGDLFEAGLPALAHGCNAVGIMGGGIATKFRSIWPEMYREYRRLCRDRMLQLGSVFPWYGHPVIFNLITQPLPGPSAFVEAIESSMDTALGIADELEISCVGIPRIGTGLGGLAWEDVAPALETVEKGHQTELVVYTLRPTNPRGAGSWLPTP